MKTYVLMIAKNFPTTHPRKGEPTNFKKAIREGVKIHTIRGNYDLWKKRIEEVNRGESCISRREWEGSPYNSKQVEIDNLYKVGYEDVIIRDRASVGDMLFIDEEILAKNDGLSLQDFNAWFKKPLTNGIIIHFTDFRYTATQWHTPDEKPEPYTSVLAKWEDGSLGLVYVTHINQWKLSGYGVLEGSRLKFIWTNDIPQPTEEDFKLLNK